MEKVYSRYDTKRVTLLSKADSEFDYVGYHESSAHKGANTSFSPKRLYTILIANLSSLSSKDKRYDDFLRIRKQRDTSRLKKTFKQSYQPLESLLHYLVD